jgi:hypothetical protein
LVIGGVLVLSGCSADATSAPAEVSHEELTKHVDDASVWPADRTLLVAEASGDGYSEGGARGSTCRLGAAKYTLDVAARTLSWTKCNYTGWTTLDNVSGSRVLAPADLAVIDAAMFAMRVSSDDRCGADKPLLKVHVTSASAGTRSYLDSFYSCFAGGELFVDNIDEVFGLLDAFTG